MDIRSNRRAQKYSAREQALRLAWTVGKLLFRFSPRPLFGWRRTVLTIFGAQVGVHVNVYPSAEIYFPWNLVIGDWSSIGEQAYIYNLGKVSIGSKVTVSYRAHLCAGTHDVEQSDFPLRKPPIIIHDGAWICTEAFIGPGVTVGESAVAGARSVVVRDVPARAVVVGNPARIARFLTSEPVAQ